MQHPIVGAPHSDAATIQSAASVELHDVELTAIAAVASAGDDAAAKAKQIQKQQTPPSAAATADDAAAATSSPYLDFLSRLHRAWPDAPTLSVSFHNLSVLFPRPLHIEAEDNNNNNNNPSSAAEHAAKRSVPNLASTLRHWVTLPGRALAAQVGFGPKPLLAIDSASGHIAPGTMTLILSPPGGGKTTMLKALSGRLPASTVRGSLLFNGLSSNELAARGVQLPRLASYVGQVDLHFATLTVRETLTFAARSSVPSAKLLPGIDADPELESLEARRADLLIDMLGLNESADVIVGNDMLRGVSGGQKKRVTLGEMIVGNARLLALDEVTTGLDSEVSSRIFSQLKQVCAVSGTSVVAALLQPTPLTYEQFDQIMLLHEGRVVYSGPRTDVKRWLWQVCGVDVPVDVDEASFLVDFLANPQLATESAHIVAQTQSVVQATRADRVKEQVAAEEEEQKEAASLAAAHGQEGIFSRSGTAGVAPPALGASPTPEEEAVRDPALYEQYATYAGTDVAHEVSRVRFHLADADAEDDDEEQDAPGGAFDQLPLPGAKGKKRLQQKKSSIDAAFAPVVCDSEVVTAVAAEEEEESSQSANNHELASSLTDCAKQKAKQLPRSMQHSTAGAIPALNMSQVHTRYLCSRWHERVALNHSLHAAGTAGTAALDPTKWSAYSIASFSAPQPHSYREHLDLCFGRQWLLFKRNRSVLIPRMMKALLIGLLYGLLFFRLGENDFIEKLAVAMYGTLFAAMTNLSELPVASEARNVIAKQIVAGWFPASSYYAGVCAMHIPLTLLESVCYSVLIYNLSGMAPDVGRYFFYLLVCIIASNAMATFYRFISYITSNPDIAKQLDLPFVVLFIILNAFIIVYSKIPLWLRSWAFWIAPLQWGTRALTLNEFNDPSYDLPAPADPSQRLGDYYLRSFDLPTDFIWKWMGPVYLIGWFVFWTMVCIFFLAKLKVIAPQGTERERYKEASNAVIADDKQEEEAVGVASPEPGAAAAQIMSIPPLSAQEDVLINIDAPRTPRAKKNAAFQLSALPFEPVVLTWTDLSYSVPLPDGSERQLLNKVAGFSKANTMTALMGASGAGKTTLMDCIAGRKTTGTLTADIRVNGTPVDIHSAAFQRICGYVEQTDQHIGTSTVQEALEFSARLRLPTSVSLPTQQQFVKEVMELLGLTPFKDNIIGDAAIAGLAPAQLKLVTIGVELVANPSILFLDEPTSGLDAPASWRVMTAIKRISLTGRTVLCTIHQPAARLFYLFDRLLLLQPGGNQIYFDSIGSRGSNPADWMLDVANDSSTGVVWNTHWNKSKAFVEMVQPMLHRALLPPSNSSKQESKDAAAASVSVVEPSYASWWVRYSAVQKRLFLSYWRNGPMNLTRAAVVLVIGVLLGVLYYRIRPTDYAGLNSFLAGIFMSLGFGPSLPASAALPTFFRQRAVMYRESTVRCYSQGAYALSLTVCEAIAMSILMMIYILPLYFLMGLADNAQQFWRFYLILYIMSQVYASLSQLYLALLPNQVSASVVHSIVFSFLFVFGGLLVTIKKMPQGWRWFYFLISTPKAYVAVALGQLSCSDSSALEGGFGCGYIVTPESPEPQQVYGIVSDMLQNSADSYGNQIGWLILIVGVLKIGSLIGFYTISHLKR